MMIVLYNLYSITKKCKFHAKIRSVHPP